MGLFGDKVFGLSLFCSRLVQGLEGDSRSVIEIRSQRPDNSDKPQLVFDIHCSNVADVLGLRDEISNNTDDVAKLLVKTVALVADFDRVAIRWKEPEHSCQVPELEDFVLHVSRKSATRVSSEICLSQVPGSSTAGSMSVKSICGKTTFFCVGGRRKLTRLSWEGVPRGSRPPGSTSGSAVSWAEKCVEQSFVVSAE